MANEPKKPERGTLEYWEAKKNKIVEWKKTLDADERPYKDVKADVDEADEELADIEDVISKLFGGNKKPAPKDDPKPRKPRNWL